MVFDREQLVDQLPPIQRGESFGGTGYPGRVEQFAPVTSYRERDVQPGKREERHGLDVNLLLFCCWAGVRGRALTGGDLERLVSAVRPWQEGAVKPLRAARRWLKRQATAPGELAEPLRQRIKEQELTAERIEQQVLADILVPDAGDPEPGAAATNLRLYLGAALVRPRGVDLADLGVLLAACFEGLTVAEAKRQLA